MKRCSLFCAGWWPFIFLPLLLLAPLLVFNWHAIEADVANNTRKDLAESELDWAGVETMNRGREVLLTGTPPNQASIDNAVQVAKSAYGVNSVTLSAEVTPPLNAAQLNAAVTGTSIVLSGNLASKAEITRVVSQAEASFGKGNVINKLTVRDNTAELSSVNGLFNALASNTPATKTLTASINGDALTLSGAVANDTTKSAIGQQMNRIFGNAVDNQIVVVPPPIKRDVCQDLVNDLLKQGKINFDSGNATITQDSFALLEKIKTTAQRCSDASFEVSGHTDSTGNLAFNMSLSERRAQAVVDHLVGLGLSTEQFEARGYGPNQAIADNGTADGRAQNRRIEFRLKN